jgi:hypothetical protein
MKFYIQKRLQVLLNIFTLVLLITAFYTYFQDSPGDTFTIFWVIFPIHLAIGIFRNILLNRIKITLFYKLQDIIYCFLEIFPLFTNSAQKTELIIGRFSTIANIIILIYLTINLINKEEQSS